MIIPKSTFQFAIIACVSASMLMTGCRINMVRKANHCDCQTQASNAHEDCQCQRRWGLFGNLRARAANRRPVLDSSPYNLPQNQAALTGSTDQCDCQGQTSLIQDPADKAFPQDDLNLQSPAETPTKEFESVPQVEPNIIESNDFQSSSSRIKHQRESIEKTISQLKPPVEPSSTPTESDFAKAAALTESSVLKSEIFDAIQEKPYYTPEEESNQPTVEQSFVPAKTSPLDSNTSKEKANAASDLKLDQPFTPSIQVAKPTKPNSTPTPATQKSTPAPGSEFEKLAEQIFNEIDLKEDLKIHTQPLPQQRVPSRPASFQIESNPEPIKQKKIEEVEVFGAIQFDAVLRRAAQTGLYARQEDDQVTKRPVSNFTANATASEDIDFMIRPLPQLVKKEVANNPTESFEFQTMPAYHMPTLRAIPQTAEHTIRNSSLRINHSPTTAEPTRVAKKTKPTWKPLPKQPSTIQAKPQADTELSAITIRNSASAKATPLSSAKPQIETIAPSNLSPVAPLNEAEEELIFEPLPIESKPIITPLPQVPGGDSPTSDQATPQSIRGLTQRSTSNPLR